MMMETVLPVYLESLEEDDHYNMQLPDRMEQKIGVESARTVCKREMRPAGLGNPIWNPNIATQHLSINVMELINSLVKMEGWYCSGR